MKRTSRVSRIIPYTGCRSQVLNSSPLKEGPVSERIVAIDVVRGFTILGILLANMLTFAGPYHQYVNANYWSGADYWTLQGIRLLVEGRFLPILSFLFGLGLVMQYNRRESGPYKAFLSRRMLVLLLIGWAHYLFLWQADILTSYALLGLLAVLLVKRSVRFHLITTGVTILFWLSLYVTAWVLAGDQAPVRDAAEAAEKFATFSAERIQEHSGSWFQSFMGRAEDFGGYIFSSLFSSLIVLPALFLGMAAGRARLHQSFMERTPQLKRLALGLSVIAVPCVILDMLLRSVSQTEPFSSGTFAWMVCFVFGSLTMALVYIIGVLQLAHFKMMKPLVAVGRLSLSCYLMQSLICTFIFDGYGLGLYTRIGPFYGFLMSLAVFALNIGFALLWTRRFPASKSINSADVSKRIGFAVPGINSSPSSRRTLPCSSFS